MKRYSILIKAKKKENLKINTYFFIMPFKKKRKREVCYKIYMEENFSNILIKGLIFSFSDDKDTHTHNSHYNSKKSSLFQFSTRNLNSTTDEN